MSSETLREWLRNEIMMVLKRRASSPPLVLWCDAECAWREVLRPPRRAGTESLISALARFGVEIARDHEAELRRLLPAHAKEWIDRPRSAWRELTPGNAKSTLVDDDQILVTLARPDARIVDGIGEDCLSAFTRRVTEDFGPPAPVRGKDDDWRPLRC